MLPDYECFQVREGKKKNEGASEADWRIYYTSGADSPGSSQDAVVIDLQR